MRAGGILLHISSLPSKYGIGSLGREAREFVDFLKKAGQKYWQILPLSQTSYGDSPYQSFSAFAGNPYFIDLDILAGQGYLKPEEFVNISWGKNPERVDYGILYEKRYPVLRSAAKVFLQSPPEDFYGFCQRQAFWLDDYVLFMAIKNAREGVSWMKWEHEIRHRDPVALEQMKAKYQEEMDFWRVVQYLFWTQWMELKTYANVRGITIVGDAPIYVAEDSCDVWASPESFQLDEDLIPTKVAGCPPDGFSSTGQLWGNPLFDWEQMAKDGYSWWVERIRFLSMVYDVVRIDHFRGLEAYYAVPYGDEDASGGSWMPGPGMDFINTVREKLGELRLIAEDLGHQTASLRDFLSQSMLPGMKVLEFAFDSRDDTMYLPECYKPEDIVYTGTHDNEPLGGWLTTAPESDVEYAKNYLKLNEDEGYIWGMLRSVWASRGDLAVVQMQDVLELGTESRMNTPSTLGGNWVWRLKGNELTDELGERIRLEMVSYNRN